MLHPRPSLPCALGLCAAVLFAAGLTSRGDDWPQFLGPTRDGVYRGNDLADTWPENGPSRVWQTTVGEGFSGPVVASERLILYHRVGAHDRVECLDAHTGTELWSFQYATTYRDGFGFNNGPRATPTVYNGKVYTFSAQGLLHCLDLQTGTKLWRVDTDQEFSVQKGFFGAACSPLVDDGRVMLNIGGRNNAGIVAFDADNGQALWTATDHEASYSAPVIATVHGKRHGLFFTRHGLVDLDPTSGTLRFQFRWRSRRQASVNAATPLVAGDKVFISASYGIGALAIRINDDGYEKLWSADEVLSNHYATSVSHQGYLYGFDGRQEYRPSLRCVELTTGQVRWSQDRFGAGTLTLANNRLLILHEHGQLILAPASPKGFKPSAQAQLLSGTVRPYPALADGRLYARNEDTLVCVDLRPQP